MRWNFLIRVELWGPAAKAHLAQITAADEADGFAEVKLRSVEVGASKEWGLSWHEAAAGSSYE